MRLGTQERKMALRSWMRMVLALSIAVPLISPWTETSSADTPRGAPICTGNPGNLLYPLDFSHQLVDFWGDGPTGSGPAEGPDQHNDDDSAAFGLPFAFDFDGALYRHCFINNNGNISFGSYFSEFNASGFPIPDVPMIAPFWADVDTGSSFNPIGDVWWKLLDSNSNGNLDTLVVTWDRVGYYNEQPDRRNTFQLVISDGSNPRMSGGSNVCFSYNNMCWTTGDASLGNGGFFGVPATVGINYGDGTNSLLIGRFDHPGTDYDGPAGNHDGVDYLDHRVICLDVSGREANEPPIPEGLPPSGRVDVRPDLGQSVNLQLRFLSPEPGQTTVVVMEDLNAAGARGLSAVIGSGNVAVVDLSWTPACGDAGQYRLRFTATDDFNPPGSTSVELTIGVVCEDAGACCLSNGRCLRLSSTDCGLISGSQWAGLQTSCVDVAGTPTCPLGACCLPNGACTGGMLQADCVSAGGDFREGIISCAQANCPLPDGACCLNNGNCLVLSTDDCRLFAGGAWAGPNTECFIVQGTPRCPSGACCRTDGSCVVSILQNDCAAMGGTFRGPGSTCIGANCPQPPGACCLPNGNCLSIRQADCQLAPSARWAGPNTTCVDGNANGRADVCESVPGDVNGDGAANPGDIPPFIAVLLGTPQSPEHVGRSDVNHDGAANGRDVASFIAAIAGP